MNLHNDRRLPAIVYKQQKGVTLIELLVAMGILGFLSAAIAVTFSVVMNISTTAMGQNVVLSQVRMAGNWISRDVQNAKFGTVDNTTGLCSMECSVLNGSTFSTDNETVNYTINNGILTRTSQIGSNPANNINVAQYIDGNSTSLICENATEKLFNLTVKANYLGSTYTKVYKIKQVLAE